MNLTKVNSAGLQRKLRAMDLGGRLGVGRAVMNVADVFIEALEAGWPRDTNRSIAGWIRAANDAGLTPRPIPVVVASQYHDWLVARLETQNAFYQKLLKTREEAVRYWSQVYENRYKREARRDKWAQDCLAKKRAAEKGMTRVRELARRAQEQLEIVEANPDAVVIWGKELKAGLAADEDLRLGRLATTRVPIYGGVGRVVQLNGRTFVILHNLEPHTSIVESNTGVIRNALGVAKVVGGRRIRGQLRKQIRAAVR